MITISTSQAESGLDTQDIETKKAANIAMSAP